jgi:DNA repair protein RadA/Sms
MLLALLEKKLDVPLGTYDVFVNVSGGIRITEPAADLAVIAAILSSYRDRPLSSETVFVGEVSLTGEVRDVPQLALRLRELETQGFKKAVVPVNLPTVDIPDAVKLYKVGDVEKVVEWM